jgi:hypothetical protein
MIKVEDWVQWLTLVIPAIWKAEIRRVSLGSQPEQKVNLTLVSTTSWTLVTQEAR